MPMTYWSEHLMDLHNASSFPEVGEIALRVLDLMPDGDIHQVCGPISTGGFGCRDKNRQLFGFAVDELVRQGHLVFNQVPLEYSFQKLVKPWMAANPDADYPMPILEEVYARIFESGRIKVAMFLPDWHDSFGTRWEHDKVTSLGIEVCDYPREWLREEINNIHQSP